MRRESNGSRARQRILIFRRSSRRYFLATLVGFNLASSYKTEAATIYEPRRSSETLVLGDSVFALIGQIGDAKTILHTPKDLIFAAQPCQRLLARGCMEVTPNSAFDIYSLNRYRITGAVVVATGYNDIGVDVLSSALAQFCSLAGQLGHRLVWVTYAERGSVRARARKFNAELRKFRSMHDGFSLADWNSLAGGTDRYFSPDGVHLSRSGAILAARLLTEALSLPIHGPCASVRERNE